MVKQERMSSRKHRPKVVVHLYEYIICSYFKKEYSMKQNVLIITSKEQFRIQNDFFPSLFFFFFFCPLPNPLSPVGPQ